MPTKELDVPEELDREIEAFFGTASNTDRGTYQAALWYAVDRYKAEHDISVAYPDDETE